MQTNILADIEAEVYSQPATLAKRFLNLLLDIIGFYVFVFFVGITLGFASEGAGQDIYGDHSNLFFEYFLSYFCYLIYYTLLEGATKGRSLGKLITGTVAVKNDGSAITRKDALMRSLCRLVPFEAFSAFGYAPWHDKWTDTTVIKSSTN